LPKDDIINKLPAEAGQSVIISIHEGIVISVRQDGPYAQLIIEHGSSQKFWTVYEHVAGIKVRLNEQVTPYLPIVYETMLIMANFTGEEQKL
jgi:hypothetical protein